MALMKTAWRVDRGGGGCGCGSWGFGSGTKETTGERRVPSRERRRSRKDWWELRRERKPRSWAVGSVE